ncbi:MAG TPA: NrfD/PsrC family molybdoenzyme membrane anchor subunit [Verrucomicrobiae bacterium]|nr:NrfD/PsrC family molybdoenzyme membrane anchor subunit [Verrucomicrobiae bacterium]
MSDLLEPPGREETIPTPTYYGRPLLKMPHWDGWNVVTYLFLGGVMGGLGVIGVLADPKRESDRKLKRTLAVTSLVLAAANPSVLVTHLGRPERFLHMLRIVKIKSPMSMGVWGLVLYSGAAGMNVARELAQSGVLPRWLRFLAPPIFARLQAVVGAFLMGYTGVLLSATANPLWSSGKRHIPVAFVCSSMSSACALASLLSTVEGNSEVTHRLERLEMLASAGELAALVSFERHAGDYGKALFTGPAGDRLRTYTTQTGILAPIALNLLGAIVPLPKPVDAVRTVIASVLTLIGGYNLRNTVVQAGRISVNDPSTAFVQPK